MADDGTDYMDHYVAAKKAAQPAAAERCKAALGKAWDECDHLDRFEAWADLYLRRFGRLSPGKSDPRADSNSPENNALCEAWHKSGLAAHDAIMEVARLTEIQEQLGQIDEAYEMYTDCLSVTQEETLEEIARILGRPWTDKYEGDKE